MDILWIVIGAILSLLGIAGALLPVIPGPPLSFFGLLVLQFMDKPPFSARFLVIWALIAVGVVILDYVVPVWGTKKFGGSKLGVWGSIAGLIIGLPFGPWGIILGPFVGALIGELISGKEFNPALRAGFGSFIGFITGVVMKLAVSIYMAYEFVNALV